MSDLTLEPAEFAARRRVAQEEAIAQILPAITAWVNNLDNPNAFVEVNEVLATLYTDTYVSEGGDRRARVAGFLFSLRGVVNHTMSTSDPGVVSTWLAVATINAATLQAATEDPRPLLLKWTTMHDSAVREAHAAADRQRRPAGSVFHVGGERMRYPGDPRGSIENTINCRCVLQPVPINQSINAAATKETPMPLDAPLAWHGVLAPEEEWSGDGRRFASGALTNRDLPLPLTWQKASSEGHDGSTVVARIDSIERVDNMIRGEGVFIDTPETDEVVGLIAEFGKFGVSIDADDSEFEFDEESGKITFSRARIASASIVPIPAFASAFVSFGTWADSEEMAGAPPFPPKKKDSQVPEKEGDDDQEGEPKEEECDPDSPDYEDCIARQAPDSDEEPDWVPVAPKRSADDESIAASVAFISDKAWDGSAGRFTPEQWKKSTILHVCDGMEKSCHKLPIKEPDGALSRAGVHAAASRFGSVDAPAEAKASAARALRGAYKQLGEEPPDKIKSAAAETESFDRGPGWVTNPVETRRLWAYWTQPGHEGYAKINWGVPGDFNRCRSLVGEKIAANSPEDLRFLNQICARWHHDATGFWPGRAPSEQVGAGLGDSNGPALTLVAAAGKTAPASWFVNPGLSCPTHLTVTEEGRVFGHIAEWKTCHIGYDGVCVAPPSSASDYAYFASKAVLLDDGTFANTGVISLGGGHAAPGKSVRGAIAHYDSTSTGVADVSVGEDEHGIWCAGWIRPGTTEKQVYDLRASDVSGDWREVRPGQMEMVAALAVNVAGFPVVSVHDRTQVSLVAAGVVTKPDDPMDQVVHGVLAALARRDKMAELRRRVNV